MYGIPNRNYSVYAANADFNGVARAPLVVVSQYIDILQAYMSKHMMLGGITFDLSAAVVRVPEHMDTFRGWLFVSTVTGAQRFVEVFNGKSFPVLVAELLSYDDEEVHHPTASMHLSHPDNGVQHYPMIHLIHANAAMNNRDMYQPTYQPYQPARARHMAAGLDNERSRAAEAAARSSWDNHNPSNQFGMAPASGERNNAGRVNRFEVLFTTNILDENHNDFEVHRRQWPSLEAIGQKFASAMKLIQSTSAHGGKVLLESQDLSKISNMITTGHLDRFCIAFGGKSPLALVTDIKLHDLVTGKVYELDPEYKRTDEVPTGIVIAKQEAFAVYDIRAVSSFLADVGKDVKAKEAIPVVDSVKLRFFAKFHTAANGYVTRGYESLDSMRDHFTKGSATETGSLVNNDGQPEENLYGFGYVSRAIMFGVTPPGVVAGDYSGMVPVISIEIGDCLTNITRKMAARGVMSKEDQPAAFGATVARWWELGTLFNSIKELEKQAKEHVPGKKEAAVASPEDDRFWMDFRDGGGNVMHSYGFNSREEMVTIMQDALRIGGVTDNRLPTLADRPEAIKLLRSPVDPLIYFMQDSSGKSVKAIVLRDGSVKPVTSHFINHVNMSHSDDRESQVRNDVVDTMRQNDAEVFTMEEILLSVNKFFDHVEESNKAHVKNHFALRFEVVDEHRCFNVEVGFESIAAAEIAMNGLFYRTNNDVNKIGRLSQKTSNKNHEIRAYAMKVPDKAAYSDPVAFTFALVPTGEEDSRRDDAIPIKTISLVNLDTEATMVIAPWLPSNDEQAAFVKEDLDNKFSIYQENQVLSDLRDFSNKKPEPQLI